MKSFASMGLALVLLGWSACDSSAPPVVSAAPSHAPDPTPAPTIDNDQPFSATGPIVVENQLDVAAQREGVVAAIHAEPGTAVEKGQLLAMLDDRQISADVAAAAAKVRSIEANLKNWQAETKVLQADRSRAEKLYEAQVIPKEEMEHVQYKEEADEYEVQREAESLNNARELEKSLELERDKTRIVAPFSGIVARRYVRVGQKVGIGDRLFWVTALGPLQVKFTLPEHFIAEIKRGERVSVVSADISGAPRHPAKVIDVSPVVDPSSGTIEVLAEIEGAAADLRPGMLASIRINPKQ